MCGIAGLVALTDDRIDAAIARRMIDNLRHRGPDGTGIHSERSVALAHRRLSILDPSSAGAQPMCRQGAWLIHNGEVYNFLELADELRSTGRTFTTGTDTEVILAAYDAWGVDAISRFEGMWAFALWDSDRRRLILARDRLGVKPLYVRRTSRSLVFASEPQALVDARGIDPSDHWEPTPDLGAVHDFLTRGKVDHSDHTFVSGISSLAAGHALMVENGRERLLRYWSAPPLADDDRAIARGTDRRNDSRLLEQFAATFDSAVRLHLRSDVSLGTCLSGGLDSSAIVATAGLLLGRDESPPAAREQPAQVALHARFPENGIDESTYAEAVAAQYDVRLVSRTPRSRPFLGSVISVLRAQGEPYGGASIHAQHAVMAAARAEGLKVLLDGQGADELLGGYLPYLGVRSTGLLASGDAVGAVREVREQVRRGPLTAVGALSVFGRAALRGWPLEVIRRAAGGRYAIRCQRPLADEAPLDRASEDAGTLLARRLWRDLTVDSLPALLRYEDRNSMAFGIEARVPFLDVRLVELAVRMPDRLRISGGETKLALRRAMRGRLPDNIVERRDKVSFAAPESVWLNASHGEIRLLLSDGQLVRRGWIAQRDIESLLDDRLSGHQGEQLWRLVVVESWLRLVWPGAASEGGRRTWEAALAAEPAARRSLTDASGLSEDSMATSS